MAAKEKFSVDFIGIGAPRCGTTWLAKCLAEHPDVCFSSVKETHFFDRPLEMGTDIDTYEQFFPCWQEKRCTGEFTPDYYYHTAVAERIAAAFPDVKILVMLRDPVARAYSNYRYRAARIGVSQPLGEYFREEHWRIIESGRYAELLIPFTKHFNDGQIHVMVLEEMQRDPHTTFSQLCTFLGIDSSYEPPSLLHKRNAADNVSYAFPSLNRFIEVRRTLKRTKQGLFLVRQLKRLGVNWFVKRGLALNAWLGRRRGTQVTVEPLTIDMQERLRSYYADDVAVLSNYLGRDMEEMWWHRT